MSKNTVELPDGRVISDWPWIITPNYINVMVETEEGKFICFRQTKYPVEGTSFAPVGGYLEPGEAPIAAAQRELLEETGYQARMWISLGRYGVDGNRGVGFCERVVSGDRAQTIGRTTRDECGVGDGGFDCAHDSAGTAVSQAQLTACTESATGRQADMTVLHLLCQSR